MERVLSDAQTGVDGPPYDPGRDGVGNGIFRECADGSFGGGCESGDRYDLE